MDCWSCGFSLSDAPRVGFRDECPRCANPLHCCRNCKFYDQAYHNQCREPMAELVADKERANFCEYFTPAGKRSPVRPQNEPTARDKLEALFKKKRP
jgi:hypothetical protein